MKLGRYDSAADAYASALSDASYGKVGALSCNRGRALLAAGRAQEAIQALTSAVQDNSYSCLLYTSGSVADDTDDRLLVAGRDVRLIAAVLDPLDEVAELLLCGGVFYDGDHFFPLFARRLTQVCKC